MDLRHLRYFVAVAEARSFTRAAQALHVSQPPLSRQIQDLETELGVALFERGARPLQLTHAGRHFYAHAVRLLLQADQVICTTQRIAHIKRRLVIGFVPSTLYGELPTLVRRFRARCPDTELALEDMATVEQIAALKAGRVDVGFGRVRLSDPDVRREVLRDERLVVAVPSDHPLAGSAKPVRLREVAQHEQLLYPAHPRPGYADQVLSLFGDLGLTPAIVQEVRELQTALGLVAAGVGVCVVPESAAQLRPEAVLYRPLRDRRAVSPIIMSTRLEEPSADLSELRTLVAALYGQAPQPPAAKASRSMAGSAPAATHRARRETPRALRAR